MILRRWVPLSIVLCFLVGSTAQSLSAAPLRVLSWNIQFGEGTDGVTNFDRIATWLARMNPDLIALCEMPPDQVPTLVSLLRQKTGRAWYSHFVPKSPGTSEGNLILSAYGFGSTSSRYLSYNRSIAQATINVGGSNVNFFATHLDHTSSALRLTEANELIDWTSGFAGPRIVAGDMNAGNDTPEILRLLGVYRDSWVDSLSLGAAFAYPDNPVWLNTRTRRWRIDFIFYSADTSVFAARTSNIPDTRDLSNTNVVNAVGTTDDRGVRPSDHNLVVTDFDVVSAAPPAPAPSAAAPILLTRGGTDRAIALHSTLFNLEPFAVRSPVNLSGDQRTRIMLFATNLELLSGETPSSVTVRAIDSRGITYDLPIEQMIKIPNFAWLSTVIVRLPDDQSINGDLSVTVGIRGAVSSAARIGIKLP
jgi:endonuclease/exonuclease/phosphatase family metal-dependent hydrolase